MPEILHFRSNLPVQVALAYATGRRKKYGTPIMFTLVDGRRMFLDVSVAFQIERLGIRARQPFYICQYTHGPIPAWRVWPPGETPLPGQPAQPEFFEMERSAAV